MAKPDYFLLPDTETTQDQLVADFGAVVVNRKGEIMTQCAALVFGIYNDSENHPLFHLFGDSGDLWSKAGLPKRYEKYNAMIANGQRSLSGVGAINRWLDKVMTTYSPILTAYNLSFDLDKCYNTGIDLAQFRKKKFCLWHAAYTKWAHTKAYKNFVLQCHGFNPVTRHGNATYQTNAEIMTRFVLNDPDLADEPHTALEDVIDYELPILLKLVNSTKKKIWMNPKPYNWRDVQLKNHFQAI